MWSKMQILEGHAEFESFCLHCRELYNSAAEATSLLSSVASLVINVKFKMIGMLLNVVQGPKSEKPTMHITNNCNGFHYTLLTMHGANATAIRVNATNKSILHFGSLSAHSNNEEYPR